MSIPLEDQFTDVIGKAQKGRGISDARLAELSQTSLQLLKNVQQGEVILDVLVNLAPALALKTDALVALAMGKYRPAIAEIAGLRAFNTPYQDYTVNSYLVWDAATREAVVFDTGSDATELLHTIAAEGLKVRFILLTHTHGDHIFDLDRVIEKTGAPVFSPKAEPLEGATPFAEGETFTCGSLRIRALLTNGHSPGGTTFFIEGLATPLGVVGDSLFAGSMGGAGTAWERALSNNREKILTLPAETILCPGHGPLTTVALEREHNPFFP